MPFILGLRFQVTAKQLTSLSSDTSAGSSKHSKKTLAISQLLTLKISQPSQYQFPHRPPPIPGAEAPPAPDLPRTPPVAARCRRSLCSRRRRRLSRRRRRPPRRRPDRGTLGDRGKGWETTVGDLNGLVKMGLVWDGCISCHLFRMCVVPWFGTTVYAYRFGPIAWTFNRQQHSRWVLALRSCIIQ